VLQGSRGGLASGRKRSSAGQVGARYLRTLRAVRSSSGEPTEGQGQGLSKRFATSLQWPTESSCQGAASLQEGAPARVGALTKLLGGVVQRGYSVDELGRKM
jgi:hypothetical protein